MQNQQNIKESINKPALVRVTSSLEKIKSITTNAKLSLLEHSTISESLELIKSQIELVTSVSDTLEQNNKSLGQTVNTLNTRIQKQTEEIEKLKAEQHLDDELHKLSK